MIAVVVSVSTTPTLLMGGQGVTNYPASCLIKLPSGGGASTVYLGGPGVDTASGWPLEDGDPPVMADLVNEGLYGIVSAGSQDIHVLRSGTGESD